MIRMASPFANPAISAAEAVTSAVEDPLAATKKMRPGAPTESGV